MVKRGFIKIREGQVHYRYKGNKNKEPVILLHPGPTSSLSLVPLIEELGKRYWVVAPDIIGMGDSVGPDIKDPDISYFADAIFRFLDKLNIDKFYLWGCMTGAHCGIEMSIQQPKRVNLFYIEFLQIYEHKIQKYLEKSHAPKIIHDHNGSQLNVLWHLARDQYFFFPWFIGKKEFIRRSALPSPKHLHEKTVEILKASSTYHLALNAALKYPTEERLKQITVPVIAPKNLKNLIINFHSHENICISPVTSPKNEIIKSAREISNSIETMSHHR